MEDFISSPVLALQGDEDKILVAYKVVVSIY